MTAKEVIQAHIRKNGILNEVAFLREVRQAARELLDDCSPKNRKPERWRIIQADIGGKVICYHKSQAVCARTLGVTRQAVNNALNRQTVIDGQYRLSRFYAGKQDKTN